MAAIPPATGTGMATGTEGLDAGRLLTLAHWLSPAYPTGSFAWSHGLEQAVRDGAVTDAAGLRDWLAAVVALGAGRSDAVLLCLAHGAGDARLGALAELAAALCPGRERLAETMGQGRAFAAVTRAVWGFDLPDMPYPVALGRAARLAGLPAGPVALLFLQGMATNLALAAQRLMALGQTGAHAVLRDLAPEIAATAAFAAAATEDDIGSAVFAVDVAAMRHESLQPRIFRS